MYSELVLTFLSRGEVRYTYKHSILGYDADGSEWDGERLVPGHRVSFMVRVSLSNAAELTTGRADWTARPALD